MKNVPAMMFREYLNIGVEDQIIMCTRLAHFCVRKSIFLICATAWFGRQKVGKKRFFVSYFESIFGDFPAKMGRNNWSDFSTYFGPQRKKTVPAMWFVGKEKK